MPVRAGALGLAILMCAASCGMQPRYARDPILPELEPEPPIITNNSRIVALRTSLGRAAVSLEMRSPAVETIRSANCDLRSSERVQAGCARCELAGDGDPFDSAMLDALVVAFDRYPASVLEGAYVQRVALCKTLVDEENPTKRSIGTVDLRSRRLFVSIAPFLNRSYDEEGGITTEDIVHHELFHQLEYERLREIFDDDPEWRLLNPLGFEYRAGAEEDARIGGFINEYAASAETEDRASMFQYLLARPHELCEIAAEDPVVRAKTRLLWKRVKPLVGDEFLKRRATCVLAWLDEQETAPVRAMMQEPAPSKMHTFPSDEERSPSRGSSSPSLFPLR